MKKTERVGGAAPKFFRAGLYAKILMVLAVAVFAACDKDDEIEIPNIADKEMEEVEYY